MHGSARTELKSTQARRSQQANGGSSVAWRALLGVNCLVTSIAGIVLLVAPSAIPSVADVRLPPEFYLLSYLLGATELAIGTLCAVAFLRAEPRTAEAAALTCIVFHGLSGVATVIAWLQGADAGVLWNTAARAVMVLLFLWLAPGQVWRPAH